MSLYQQVRPKKLQNVVGNESLKMALGATLNEQPDKRNHAILFKGPSGCGKTTLALILAAEFGADENSTFVYNAANTRGIDTVREVAQQAMFSGFGAKSKVFIFDESHQITGPAQEALLKLVEDNPPHAYFIFCTTEPEKLVKTLRNRCAQYEVDLLSRDEIMQLIRSVRESEKLTFDDDLIEAISYTCEGSPRAALVSLEQVMSLPIDQALDLLVSGTPLDAKVLDLCKVLITVPEQRKKRWRDAKAAFDAISEEPEVVRRSIMTYLLNRITDFDDDGAVDVARVIDLFNVSTFYGGRSALGAIIVKACLLG